MVDYINGLPKKASYASLLDGDNDCLDLFGACKHMLGRMRDCLASPLNPVPVFPNAISELGIHITRRKYKQKGPAGYSPSASNTYACVMIR